MNALGVYLPQDRLRALFEESLALNREIGAKDGIYERTTVTAKATMGEEAFSVAFEAGPKMTLDKAAGFALEESQSHG